MKNLLILTHCIQVGNSGIIRDQWEESLPSKIQMRKKRTKKLVTKISSSHLAKFRVLNNFSITILTCALQMKCQEKSIFFSSDLEKSLCGKRVQKVEFGLQKLRRKTMSMQCGKLFYLHWLENSLESLQSSGWVYPSGPKKSSFKFGWKMLLVRKWKLLFQTEWDISLSLIQTQPLCISKIIKIQ